MVEHRTVFKVLVSAEAQFTLWPADRVHEAGWAEAGKRGSKEECVDYIKKMWFARPPAPQASHEAVVTH